MNNILNIIYALLFHTKYPCFEQRKAYMVTTDYHSGFFELDYLPDTTSETVVGKLKNNFSRHGLPHTLVSDNGRQ